MRASTTALCAWVAGLASCAPEDERTRLVAALVRDAENPLSVSDLHPVAGQRVRLGRPWAHEWPASRTWTGVDEVVAGDQEASFVAGEVGPHAVEADGVRVTVQVEEARDEGALPHITTQKALLELRGTCADRRFPRLSGPFVVGCAGGAVDTIADLRTGSVTTIDEAVDVPAVGRGVLYAPGEGLWTLPGRAPSGRSPFEKPDPVAPMATDGRRVVALLDGKVSWFEVGAATRTLIDAWPAPWYPPALAGPWIAWVDDRERMVLDTDIWAMKAEKGSPGGTAQFPLTRAPGAQRHVAGDGHALGWIDDEGVWIQDMDTNERRLYPADAGFRAGLSLWGPVGCWEDRSAGAIDVACSDGIRVPDAGWPTRDGPWLLVRKGGVPYLVTVTEYVLDDDDPRARFEGRRVAGGFRGAHVDGAVTWSFTWPDDAPWCVDEWEDDSWRPRGPMEVVEGRATVASSGDAVRLRTCPAEGHP